MIVDLNPALYDSAKKNVSLTFFYPSRLPASNLGEANRVTIINVPALLFLPPY